MLISDTQAKTVTSGELEIAHMLAVHFRCDVTFISPSRGYKVKTPDIEMNGREWEIKCALGNSKKTTIRRLLRRGKRQSPNIVLATYATALTDTFILKEIKKLEASGDVRLQKLIIIDKMKRVRIVK